MYSPYTLQELARQRHADMVREARKRELAALVTDEPARASALGRIRSLVFRRRSALRRIALRLLPGC